MEHIRYDFDTPVERRGTDSIKWDGMEPAYGRNDLMPFWIADMDFKTPPFIIEALRRRLDHEVLGYTLKNEAYFQSIIGWNRDRYGFEVQKEWIHFMPGVVPALAMALLFFTKEGDKVMVMPPIYHPFHLLPARNGRQVVWSALDYDDNGHYHFNPERFRSDIKGCRMLFLCNPHNPGGMVWKAEELAFIADVCRAENVLVCSDEIHADLTFKPRTHTPFASLGEAARMNSLTFQAPSKAFNIPGLGSAHCFVPNPELREPFFRFLDTNELAGGNLFCSIATTAAYSHGTDWLDQMLDYVQGNFRFVEQYCREHLPLIRPITPEASYLMFLDCRALGLKQDALEQLFCEKARMALNSGTMFGSEGEGFMRLNCGCPRQYLEKALGGLRKALASA